MNSMTDMMTGTVTEELDVLLEKWCDFEKSHNGVANPVLNEIKDIYSVDELVARDEAEPNGALELVLFSDCDVDDRYEWGKKALKAGEPLAYCTLANDVDFMIDEYMGDDDVWAEFYNKGIEAGDVRGYLPLATNTYGNRDQAVPNLRFLTKCGYPSLQAAAAMELGKKTSSIKEKAAWFEKAAAYDPAFMGESLWRRGCLMLKTDAEQAFTLFKKSAEAEDDAGRFYTGRCYYLADGVEEDIDEAVRYLTVPARNGDKYACYYLGCCYRDLEEYDDAVEWFSKGVEKDHKLSCRELGICYTNGNGVGEDADRAFDLFSSAGEDIRDIPFWLGSAYYSGKGVRKDYAEAMRLFRLGIENDDDSYCQLYIARMYRYGKGVPVDLKEARRWYQMAIDNDGNAPAREEIAEL